jgi:NAD(P)-dependent dehydrogenase (short-subunit alcohol dehydrogenase family)
VSADFSGRSVLITGGARGIGLATAKRFLELRARVAIGARSPSSAEEAARVLDAGDRLVTVSADVSTVAGCERTVTSCLDAFGAIDVLFTNAGNYESAPIEQMSEEVWDRTLDTHLKGTFFCIKAALGALRASRGCIITMSSDAGLSGLKGGWSAYCAAKGGIANLTRQLAMDLAPEVRINCVAPGPVGTQHFYDDMRASAYGGFETSSDPLTELNATVPLGRVVKPEEVAQVVEFLAVAEALTGAVVSIDGGTTAGLPAPG